MKKRRFFEAHIKENSLKYILIALLFAVGVIIGAIAMLKSHTEKELADYFSAAAAEAGGGFFGNLKSCMLLHFKYLVAFALLSLSPYTACLSPAVCGLKGFSLGFSVTFLIKNYGGKGVLYGLLAVVPSAALTLPVYAFASIMCVKLSEEGRKSGGSYRRDMLAALAMIYFLMLISSAYDCTVTPVIFKRFF